MTDESGAAEVSDFPLMFGQEIARKTDTEMSSGLLDPRKPLQELALETFVAAFLIVCRRIIKHVGPLNNVWKDTTRPMSAVVLKLSCAV